MHTDPAPGLAAPASSLATARHPGPAPTAATIKWAGRRRREPSAREFLGPRRDGAGERLKRLRRRRVGPTGDER